MNILIVYAHPSKHSFNKAILDCVVDECARKGHSCAVHDLYAQHFQPVLTEQDYDSFNRNEIPADIKAEQEAVRNADVLFFIHPIWWFGLPAIFKGWIDRVFCYGFAYAHDSRGVRPLLNGKKAIIINTTGSPEQAGYSDTGFRDAMEKLIEKGIYSFVGLDIIWRRMFFQVPTAGDAARRQMIDSLHSDIRRLL
ncbi:MAG: NAD(P)H-dependent oxidoreductase [Planctomycetes bacterium]|nr:NAD(P)H-dependent oxidoreductase [Planctomycetota bacterium]